MKNILEFHTKKKQGEKIAFITCYDYTMANIIATVPGIDAVLVGDTASMVMNGYPNTTHATLSMMELHTRAVSHAIGNKKLMIGDLPFMTYRKSQETAIEAIETLMRAGAHVIKLEGARGNLELIAHVTESGIPVIGHIGLTPQHVHGLGGFKVQGRSDQARQELMRQAQDLEAAGCCALVLECMPNELAQEITQQLAIPTIGIGAGPHTDGQVLVLQDLLGLQPEFKPKFLKQYANGFDYFQSAIHQYATEVKSCEFPNIEEHSYV